MSRNFNILIQIGLGALQLLVPAFLNLTDKQDWAIKAFCIVVAGAVGITAHSFNPDGTPAGQEYKRTLTETIKEEGKK